MSDRHLYPQVQTRLGEITDEFNDRLAREQRKHPSLKASGLLRRMVIYALRHMPIGWDETAKQSGAARRKR